MQDEAIRVYGITRKGDKFLEYEAEKRKLEAKGLTAKEYERAVILLARRMGI